MIEVNKLRFSYNGKEETIKNISFSAEPGEIFGFLGPSGAGKSTTQKILIGILKRYEGSVKVMNRELRDIKKDYYEHIGVGFELPNLYTKFTALENMMFFKSLYSTPTLNPIELLKSVGLEENAATKVSDFSKGMKMRLNFCRAFLNNPKVVFLDEPTSGLDPVNSKRVKDYILKMKEQGKTIFLTTHNMNIAEELCDKVAFIVKGEIPIIDSPRELKIRYGNKRLIAEYKEEDVLISREFSLEGIGENKEFLDILRNKPLQTLHTQEATLEDIFIKVTGRSLS
ncbi:ABC transporter ATP-binding protein [Desnuesiella massiliensis]|uniref:ABC transporter ATP-binding protein n=1 Tax=Desnuesiella massiliensis TaxID=1650662 RepID=UPI0006E1B7B8|nr:ABC transporter ATP-binding protein [Desnuesiella massiliensis]